MNVVESGPKVGENLLRHELQLRPGTDAVRIGIRLKVRVRVRVKVEVRVRELWLELGLSGLVSGLLHLNNYF